MNILVLTTPDIFTYQDKDLKIAEIEYHRLALKLGENGFFGIGDYYKVIRIVNDKFQFMQEIDNYIRINGHIDRLYILAHGFEYGIRILADDQEEEIRISNFHSYPVSFVDKIKHITLVAQKCNKKINGKRSFAEELCYLLNAIVVATPYTMNSIINYGDEVGLSFEKTADVIMPENIKV